MDVHETSLAPLTQNETLSEKAYFAVRSAIISTELKPGEQITERGLARQLGISTTPIREALLRLEQEGFIHKNREKGTTVSNVASTTIAEIVLMNAALHAVAARIAATKITQEELELLRSNVEESRTSYKTADGESLLALTDRFHNIIVEASRNSILPRFLETVAAFGREDRLRGLENKEDLPVSITEHERIIEALSAEDPDLAEKLMRAHVLNAAKNLYNSFGEI